MQRIVTLVVLACSLTFTTTASDVSYLRLPSTISPLTYNLTVRPYLLESDGSKRFTFDGEVYINVTVKASTSTLVLHSNKLNYTLSEYWSTKQPDNKMLLPNPTVDQTTNTLTFNLEHELKSGTVYALHFIYVGLMGDDMRGFYRSYYTDHNNVRKWLGSTQFEPKYARRVFPSFDEPKFKATFDVTIIHHESMKAFCVTKIQSSSRKDDYIIDKFERTPKMTTYVLAFLISDFKERLDGSFGVIARPEYYNQTKFAVTIGKKALLEFDEYFGIPYYAMGNKKMQMAAIPDFKTGAMENWGLVTYRENKLLYDDKSTSLNAKQSITDCIAHELTHMWFGNLVTCGWWSYSWLNEGFARYFGTIMTAKVDASLKMEQQFVVNVIQQIMILDATNDTNALSNENLNVISQPELILSTIDYDKGASFIRMMSYIMGKANFRKSLQEYLETYKYSNTVPKNLLKIWQHYSPKAVRKQVPLVFKSFTEQVGYPVVTINVADNGKAMTITQKRFLTHPHDGSDGTLLYTIPLSYTTSEERDFNATAPKLFMQASKATTTVQFKKPVEWVVANIQETGLYRVNYNNENWLNIQKALRSPNWGGIHELNRAQIIDDLFHLALSNDITYDLALSILEYLPSEENYLPWLAALKGYAFLQKHLAPTTAGFANYILKLVENTYNHVGFDEKPSDTALEIYKRSNILNWACRFGNTQCRTEALRRFRSLQSVPVPVNIRYAVYCTAMRFGTETDFELLLKKYRTETVETERTVCLHSLGCVRSKSLIERFFNIIRSEDVKMQDKENALNNLISGNIENYATVLDLIIQDVDKVDTVGFPYTEVATFIKTIAKHIINESEATKLQTFFEATKSKFNISTTVKDSASRLIKNNYEWSKQNLDTFRAYFEKQGFLSSQDH